MRLLSSVHPIIYAPYRVGAGSEGALTKKPFNALCPTADLNNALVSFILTGYAGFSSAAGYIGETLRVDHDISLLMPEIWARMSEKERSPDFLIEHDYLEKLEDYEFEDKPVLKSRLGYRITQKFVKDFMVKIFDDPTAVMSEEMLKPELQNPAAFADGINNIVEAQEKAALIYFTDGGIDRACLPLKALLHIMAYGHYQNMTIDDKKIRDLFSRDYLLASKWYQERLAKKQQREIILWEKHCANLDKFLNGENSENYKDVAEDMQIAKRLQDAKNTLKRVESLAYLESLKGTIGADLIDIYPEL